MAFVYNNALLLMSGSYWTNTTHKLLLVPDTYVPDRDDVFVSAVGSSECSGSGYSRGFNSPGRKTLSTKTAYIDFATNSVKYGAANPTFTTISAGTVGAGIVVKENTTDADSLLIAYIDGSAQLTNGSDMPFLFENGICFEGTT